MADYNQYKRGDVVYLKAGGPKLVVAWHDMNSSFVDVTWFDKQDVLHNARIAALLLITEAEAKALLLGDL